MATNTTAKQVTFALPSLLSSHLFNPSLCPSLPPFTLLSQIYTVSYDGTIRALRPSLSSFTSEYHSPDHEFSCLAAPPLSSPLARTLLLGTDSGDMALIDPRAGLEAGDGLVTTMDLHLKKISTISMCPGHEHLFATCSMDRTVRLWDARRLPGLAGFWEKQGGKKGGKGGGGGSSPVALFESSHGRGVSSAYFSPDGSMLVTTR